MFTLAPLEKIINSATGYNDIGIIISIFLRIMIGIRCYTRLTMCNIIL